MKKPDCTGVLFDYDGVIADTLEDNFRAWQYAFTNHGATIVKEDFMKVEGMNPSHIAYQIGKKYGLEESLYHRIIEEKQQYYKRYNNFRLYPEIEDIVDRLREKSLRIGIVSGAAESQIKSVVPKKFLDLFDVLVSGDMVRNPKPHPQPYRIGLDLLKVPSSEAIAIEDAPLGIQSAKGAGIYCIAILSTRKRKDVVQADRIVANVGELKTVLGALL